MFEVERETFCWEDVILAAIRSGQWAALQQGTREALALAARMERGDEPEEEIEETASQFRYDRDLLRADDMEEWLAGRGVTVEEWMDMIRREVLRRRAGDDLEDSMREWEPDPDQLAEAVRVELLCGNAGAQLVLALAERAAGAAAARCEEKPRRTGDRTSVAEGSIVDSDPFQEEQADTVDTALPGLAPERARAAMGRLDRLERDYARFQESLTGAEAIDREVNRRQLDWLRFGCQTIGFTEESQAREAALCIREDGLSLEDVAADAHQPITDLRFLLSDVEAEVRPLFLAARPADLVGPIAFEDRHTLFKIHDKALPSAEDPEIRDRAAEALIGRAIEMELQRHVRWLFS